MFKKVDTVQYPEEKVPTQPRFHGRHQLNRWPDGLEKCIGCELCAWTCPADAIYVEGAQNTEEERYSPGERYGSVYQINYLRCILCGLCIEACPTRSGWCSPARRSTPRCAWPSSCSASPSSTPRRARPSCSRSRSSSTPARS